MHNNRLRRPQKKMIRGPRSAHHLRHVVVRLLVLGMSTLTTGTYSLSKLMPRRLIWKLRPEQSMGLTQPSQIGLISAVSWLLIGTSKILQALLALSFRVENMNARTIL